MRKNDTNDAFEGCWTVIFILCVIGGIIATLAKALGIDFWIMLLIIIGSVVLIAGFFVLVNKAMTENKAKEAEQRRNLAILEEKEPSPTPTEIPSFPSFSNNEEELINRSYAEYIEQLNVIKATKAHRAYLSRRAEAFRALNRNNEADALNPEIQKADATVKEASFAKKSFESKPIAFFYRSSTIKSCFSDFLPLIPKKTVKLSDEELFFQKNYTRAIRSEDKHTLWFTPAYLLHYVGPNQKIEVIEYAKLNVSTMIKTECIRDGLKPSDEVKESHFLYETRDGFPDLRFSQNPVVHYVYRGSVTIKCEGVEYRLDFPNKTLTEQFECSLKAYVSLMSEKYKEIVDMILSHDKSLNEFQDADAVLTAISLKRAELEAKEKEKRKKEEEKRREKEEKRQQLQLYKTEKSNLAAELTFPNVKIRAPFTYTPRKAALDEDLLNAALIKMINDEKEAAYVLKHNAFVESSSQKVERIKELNAFLGLDRNDGIPELHLLKPVQMPEDYLPERFMVLSNRFAKVQGWKTFKKAVNWISPKKKNNGVWDTFFSGCSYLSVSPYGRWFLLLFPYCAVLCQKNEPLEVFYYDKLTPKIEFEEKEIKDEPVPPFGELIKSRYLYYNKDGSVSRKYKDNPLLLTIRFTTVVLKSGATSFRIPVETYEKALQLERDFIAFREALTKGPLGKVYALVSRSADLEEILAAFDHLQEAEKQALERAKKKEILEKKRIEDEKKAAEAAEQEKRRAIIQRQREINEARKKEAEKQAEDRKRIAKLFDDDFDEGPKKSTAEDESATKIPFEVVGNRLISNNVFKVTLKTLDEPKTDGIVTYFVSRSKEIISNKKKVPCTPSGEETVLGFVLNSGIDYTKMSDCLMRFETPAGTLGEIVFKMNVSFYSDF